MLKKVANVTPLAIVAPLLVKVLSVILNEEGHMYMTPPLATLLSVKVLLKILNEEVHNMNMTPPLVALLLN